jgi:quercetin dioxygenase-like cupin family protein
MTHTPSVPTEYVQFDEVDDIWIRSYTIEKAGCGLSQHVHEHPHATLISRGTIEAWQDGENIGQFTAPAVLTIPAGKKHIFKALTDDVVLCCLHNLRGTGFESPQFKE